ncbi:MAG TPA: S8 family serine peptidase [Deinococcales bacterium]|nr:S8 family serine peptidase [Deinococcales bacterium]
MRNARPSALTLGFCSLTLALVLAGCSTTPAPQVSPAGGHVTAQALKYLPASRTELAAVVRLKAGETKSQVEQRIGGQVVDLESDAGFAVMGLSQATLDDLRNSGATADLVDVEPNKGTVGLPESLTGSPVGQAYLEGGLVAWSGGGLPAWSGGGLPAWSGGGIPAWSGGGLVAWSGGASAFTGPSIAYDQGGLPAWSGGGLPAWSGGGLPAWSGGGLPAWSGGNATVPGNNHTWDQIHLGAAWLAAPKLGQGVTVAVVDTGVDTAHAAFGDPSLTFTPASTWRDFVDNDNTPQDGTWPDGTAGNGWGHGTGVTGTLLQVAPAAKILPLRALNPDGWGDVTDVAQAIGYAVRQGVQVIHLSLGVDESSVVDRMVKLATGKGIYVVASAGNTGNQNVTYPAQDTLNGGTTGALTLAVASVDARDALSVFSARGAAISLTAPGEFVWTPAPGNLQAYWSGTSFAAPMATGALALGLAQNPTLGKTGLNARLLAATTDDLAATNPGQAGQMGRGRLNVENYVKAVNTLNLTQLFR